MARDTLFLLQPGFADPKRPDGPFICPHCNQIEGFLASFPELAKGIDVHRLPFPRPRQPVIDLVGEDNQGLPLLVLAGTAPDDAKVHGEVRFVAETRRILELLSERHGFPKLHS